MATREGQDFTDTAVTPDVVLVSEHSTQNSARARARVRVCVCAPCVCVCVSACVRRCLHACVCVSVCERAHAGVFLRVRVCVCVASEHDC